MKTTVLIAAAVLAFGSLAASRVIDDETLLSNPTYYNPFLPRPHMHAVRDDHSRLQFCDDHDVQSFPNRGICEHQAPAEDSMEVLEKRYQQLRAARERFHNMTPEARHAFELKEEGELLDKARTTSPWRESRKLCGEKGVRLVKKREDSSFSIVCGPGAVQPQRVARDGR